MTVPSAAGAELRSRLASDSRWIGLDRPEQQAEARKSWVAKTRRVGSTIVAERLLLEERAAAFRVGRD